MSKITNIQNNYFKKLKNKNKCFNNRNFKIKK